MVPSQIATDPPLIYGWGVGASNNVVMVAVYQGGRIEKVSERPFCWLQDGTKRTHWDPSEIDAIIQDIVENAQTDVPLCGWFWGAELALLDQQNRLIAPPLRYDNVGEGYLDWVLTEIPKEQLIESTGGAPVSRFQPYSILAFLKNEYPGLIEQAEKIVPLSDYIRYYLTGEEICDPVMSGTQGLVGSFREVYKELFGPRVANAIAPWPMMSKVSVVSHLLVGSFRHDSCESTLWASAFAQSLNYCNNWEGSWGGASRRTARRKATAAQLLACAFSYEGNGKGLRMNANIGARIGLFYKGLIALAKLRGYEELAQLALSNADRAEVIPMEFFEPYYQRELTDGASAVLARFKGDVGIAAASLLLTNLLEFDRLVNGAVAAGLMPMPREVVGTGGWYQNPAYLKLVTDRYGMVTVPPGAGDATVYGSAIDALMECKGLGKKAAIDLLMPGAAPTIYRR